MPRIQELITFCKVIENKSFSRAAEFLGLTQPAVSLQIKSLEEEFGVELLHRESIDILPTDNGIKVYRYACQIIDLYEKSLQSVQEDDEELRGQLLVGASTGPGELLIPLLIAQFQNLWTGVDVPLRVGDSDEIIDQIITHRLEVGFVGSTRKDRTLKFEPFIHDHLVLIINPDHPWAGRSKISYDEFLKTPLILQQHGSGATAALIEVLGKNSISLNDINVVMVLGLQESTKVAVKAGFGATIISRLGVLEELGTGRLIEVDIDGLSLNRDLFIVGRRNEPLSRSASSFINFVNASAKKTLRQLEANAEDIST